MAASGVRSGAGGQGVRAGAGGTGVSGSGFNPDAESFDPTTFGAVLADYDFSKTANLTILSGRITAMTDPIGSAGPSLTEAGTGPLLSNINGRQAADFSANNGCLRAASSFMGSDQYSAGTGALIVTVCLPRVAQSSWIIGNNGTFSTNNRWYQAQLLLNTGQQRQQFRSDSLYQPSPAGAQPSGDVCTLGEPVVVVTYSNKTIRWYQKNGVDDSTYSRASPGAAASWNTTSTRFSIGAQHNNDGSTQTYFGGEIGRVLVYNVSAVGNVDAIVAALMAEWSV